VSTGSTRALARHQRAAARQLGITDELLALNEKQAPIFYEGRRRGRGGDLQRRHHSFFFFFFFFFFFD